MTELAFRIRTFRPCPAHPADKKAAADCSTCGGSGRLEARSAIVAGDDAGDYLESLVGALEGPAGTRNARSARAWLERFRSGEVTTGELPLGEASVVVDRITSA